MILSVYNMLPCPKMTFYCSWLDFLYDPLTYYPLTLARPKFPLTLYVVCLVLMERESREKKIHVLLLHVMI